MPTQEDAVGPRDNPDRWSETEWVARVEAACSTDETIDPMQLVEAVNRNEVTITRAGRIAKRRAGKLLMRVNGDLVPRPATKRVRA